MTLPFPEPTDAVASRSLVFLGYLDYFRSRIIAKVEALSPDEQRSSRLPSGWTPLELVKHLTFVELRWLEWGFEGNDVADPWGDGRENRWYVAPDETAAALLTALGERGAYTRRVILGNDLDTVGAPSDRWDGAHPPRLERILFHLMQEYARHLGHLDIVAELAGGPTGQ